MRAVVSEAAYDPALAAVLAAVERERRVLLRDLVARAQGLGAIARVHDPDLVVDALLGAPYAARSA